MPEGLLGHPSARQQFNRFYSDAVFLWKHDKKADAAFILGRANAATVVTVKHGPRHVNGLVQKDFRKL